MKCPNCGAEVDGKFCSYCGSELPKKEPNIHIEHNETIINNYEGNRKPNYDTIYEEEKMRARARGRIIAEAKEEADRKATKEVLVGFCVFAAIVIFIYFKISSWWNEITDDGVTPIKEDKSAYETVVNIEDNKDFFDNFNSDDKEKWYRIEGTVKSVSDITNSIDIYVYENSYEYFDLDMEETEDISLVDEGQKIIFIGYLSRGSHSTIYFEHCIIDG